MLPAVGQKRPLSPFPPPESLEVKSTAKLEKCGHDGSSKNNNVISKETIGGSNDSDIVTSGCEGTGWFLYQDEDENSAVLASRQRVTLCLVGRGKLRQRASTSRIAGEVSAAPAEVNTSKPIGGGFQIHGYTTYQPTSWRVFESPSWTSSITVEMEAGCHLEIKSLPIPLNCPKDLNKATGQRTFRVVGTNDPKFRPTVVTSSWQQAADAILNDWQAQAQPAKGVSQPQPNGKQNTPPSSPSCCELHSTRKHRGFIIAVAGAKGVGKSTFMRYIVNRLLSLFHENADSDELLHNKHRKVAVLDADCGQPEFSPPGLLTLTLASEPLWKQPHHNLARNAQEQKKGHDTKVGFFFGSNTSQTDPERYITTIQALLDSYHEILDNGDDSVVPLVVNLDGWVKGLGLQVLQAVLAMVQPNHVVSILGDLKSRIFDLTDKIPDGTALHTAHSYNSEIAAAIAKDNEGIFQDSTPAWKKEQAKETKEADNNSMQIPLDTTKMMGPILRHSPALEPNIRIPISSSIPAAALRTLRLSTYFLGYDPMLAGVRFGQGGMEDFTCHIGNQLAAMKPYLVAWEHVDCHVIGNSDIQSHDAVMAALNGSIVGLCSKQATKITNESNSNDMFPTPCLGLGIVRSIDRVRQLFYILTPVEPSELQSVNLLCKGETALPLECYFRGVYAESFPYQSFDVMSNTDILGAEPMRSRNSLSRK